MTTLIFVVIVVGVLLVGQFSWVGWLVGLVGVLLIVHIPPVKTNFLWWWGRFWTDNNTRLRTWWVLNILLFLALLVCTGQALMQYAGGCTPSKAFVDTKSETAAQSRAAYVAQGRMLCENSISRPWFFKKTLGIAWGILVLAAFGGIVYVPIALSDDLARAKEHRRTRAVTQTTQQGQPATALPAGGRAFTRGRFFEGLVAAGIMDVIVGAIIHGGRGGSS